MGLIAPGVFLVHSAASNKYVYAYLYAYKNLHTQSNASTK